MDNDEMLKTILEMIEGVVGKLTSRSRESIRRELDKLRKFVMESRPPQLMILGRRGSGKSSLINAICGEKVAKTGSVLSQTGSPVWYLVETSRGKIRLLDTRGLGDETKPESANFQDCLDEIKAAVDSEVPDAILFLCKAKEVDSRIGEDVKNLQEIRRFIKDKHQYDVPVAGIVTQVDELDPKRVEPPYENEEKKANIQTAVRALESAFRQNQIDLMRVIPISAYAEYSKDGKRTYDNYWNIDKVVEYLVEVLPKEAQLQMARIAKVRSVQASMARGLIASTATICAGIAATPIPVADILPITTAQIGMIVSIGYISGRELSRDAAKEFLTAIGVNVGAAFVLREAARALIKFVFPGAGNAVSAGVAFAGTWGIGEAAIAYFIQGKSIEEAKRRFDDTRKKKGEEGPPENLASESVEIDGS